ncbi:MAG: DUF2892 domain-containing protein [Nitrospirae bacterium]|nr:MAG: DUF2892 domain-containing protein [Nitrospirota bacterium]
MTCNLGMTERLIRIGVGVVLLALAGMAELPTWGTVLVLVVGMIAVITGAVGFCPAWKLLGIDTSESKRVKGS